MNFFFKNKKILSYLLIIPIMISLSFSSLAISKVYAVETVPPVPVSDDAVRSKFVGMTIMGYTMPWLSWNGIYILTMKTLLAHITDSIVEWINNGFEGGPSFITDPKKFLLGVGDEIAGEFINSSAWGWVCDPYKLNIKISLSLGIRNFERQKKCTLTGIINNFDNFVTGTFKEGGWKGWFEINTNPNSNQMSNFLSVQAELDKRVRQGQDTEDKKLGWGKGFLSFQECLAYDKDTRQCVKRGPIRTPGTVIESQLENHLGSSVRQMELADDIDKIVGALVQQLVKTVLEKGLSAMSSDQGYQGTAYELEAQANETPITATCMATASSARTGGDVEWTSYVAGGPLNVPVVYKWSGEGIVDSMKDNNTIEGRSLKARYSPIGTKTTTLTATKGAVSGSAQCPSLVVTAKDETAGTCSANQPEAKKEGRVAWSWEPYVGWDEWIKLYATTTLKWSGDEVIKEESGTSLNISYSTAGSKLAKLIVTTEKVETVCASDLSCVSEVVKKPTSYDCGTVNVI